jgi:hypothetical protein
VYEEALEQAEDHERTGVADMNAAVDGGAACVHTHQTRIARLKAEKLSGAGVVQLDISHGRATVARTVVFEPRKRGW